jgi:peptidoglycan hydrolase-like protein with peptidoglycan-binding domain
MKIRTIVAATSAALFSLGAIAAGDDKQKQSQGSSADKSAQTQSSGAASGSTSSQSASKPSSSAASGSTSGQASQKQAQGSDIVKQAQQKLSQAGHDVGKPDGIMGPKTQAGLKEFQEKKGLQASGQLDKQTLAALGVSGEVTTGSAATGGSSSGESKSQSSNPAASGSSSGQSQQPAASGSSSSGSSSGQSSQKKY